MSVSQRKPRPAWQNLMIAIAAMLALVAGYYLGNLASGKKPQQQYKSATVLPDAKPLTDFSLTDKNGAPLTLDSLKNRWTLVFFGYTHCPDICPTALTSMAEVNKLLPEDIRSKVQTLFVSVDPKRDTPEHLKKYVEFFNPQFMAATGEPEQIMALAKQVGIQYKLHEADKSGNYLVDHSSWLIIINPQAQFQAVVSGSHYPNPKAIASDVGLIVNSH